VIRITRIHDDEGLGGGDSIAGVNGGRVKTVEIIPTGDKWDLDVDDPMYVAGMLSEDLAIMMEGPDGQYYLKAASICVPGKFGQKNMLFDGSLNRSFRLLEARRQDWASAERNPPKRRRLPV